MVVVFRIVRLVLSPPLRRTLGNRALLPKTTDDLVDRNILYAKIYLKPARSIEFIALDFIITRTGASFDD